MATGEAIGRPPGRTEPYTIKVTLQKDIGFPCWYGKHRLSDQGLERAQDAFVLCRIFQKTGLGPPTGDRYAPFLEEEWEDDQALIVPGGESGEETNNGNGTRNDTVQKGTQTIDFLCKRVRSEDENCLKSEPEVVPSSLLTKRSKQVDLSSSQANGSGGEPATNSQDPKTTNLSSALVELPLLEPIAANRSHHVTTTPPSFDASTLEKSLPPGYLKYISDLEMVIRNVLTEKESLKLDMMQAQAMINVLHNRIDHLTKENNE